MQPVPQRMRRGVSLPTAGVVMSDTVNRVAEGEGLVKSDGELIEGRDPNSGRFTTGNRNGGRKRMDPAVRALLDKATLPAIQKLFDQLEAKKTVVVPCGRDAYTEEVPDGDLQHRAAVVLAAYGIGKPAEKLTLDPGDDGEGVRLGIVLLPASRKEDL